MKLAPLLLLLLIGCARTQKVLVPEIETVVLAPPPELTYCVEPPPLPERPYTDQAVGEYLVRLYAAHQDCLAVMDKLIKWGEDARKRGENR